MEKNLDFIFKPSLQHIATVQTAIGVWKRDDVVALIPKAPANELTSTFNAAYQARRNARNLPLPLLLKTQLVTFVDQIGKQLFDWYKYLNREFGLRERINPLEVRWTPRGTVDQRESVLQLVIAERLDAEKRYHLACTYCLTDEIKGLLKELLRRGRLLVDRRKTIVLFWMIYLTGPIAETNAERHLNAALNAFHAAVINHNATAAKFLFETVLKPAGKQPLVNYTQEMLRKIVYTPHEFAPGLLCAMLSLMDPDQRMQIFQKHPTKVLRCFLVWPYQCFFVEAAKRALRFINKSDFNSILFQISGQINHDCNACVYRGIFCAFWNLSRPEYKKYVIRDAVFKKELYYVLRRGEEKICAMMLGDVDAREKDNLARDVHVAVFFYVPVIENGNWDTLKFFLKHCALGKETIVKVRDLMIDQHVKANADKKRNFFIILDSFIPLDQQHK